ncbi:hypothetical protein D3C81_2217700 [compost metagenome]
MPIIGDQVYPERDGARDRLSGCFTSVMHVLENALSEVVIVLVLWGGRVSFPLNRFPENDTP